MMRTPAPWLIVAILLGCYDSRVVTDSARVDAARAGADPDVELLRQRGLETDKPALLAYLRNRAPEGIDPANLKSLLDKLGSEDFDERKQAAKQLVEVGIAALPALRRAETSDDAEVRKQAAACVQDIKKPKDWWVPRLVVEQLLRQPDNDVWLALLRFVPFAVEETRETIWYALEKQVRKEPKLLSLLEPGLKDKADERRALCSLLLARHGDERQKKAAHECLRDPSPEVRLRAAQGCLAAGDKQAVPVLIELLKAPSFARAWQAEELLRWFAKGKGPKELVQTKPPAERAACVEAWQKWWTEHKDKDWDPDKSPPLLVGTAESDSGEKKYAIRLYGSDGTCRWEWAASKAVFDCQFLPDDRLLIVEAEGLAKLLSERDFHGKVLWKKEISGLCRRLPDGVTAVSALKLHLFDGDQETKVEFPRLMIPVHMQMVHPHRVILTVIDGHPTNRTIVEWDPETGDFKRTMKIEVAKDDQLYRAQLIDHSRKYMLHLWQRIELRQPGNEASRKLRVEGLLDAVPLRSGTLLLSTSGVDTKVIEAGWDGRRLRNFDAKSSPVHCRPFEELLRIGFVVPADH